MRFKKPAALAFSLLLHAVTLYLLMPSSSSHLSLENTVGEGTSDVDGIDLDLVERQHSPQPQTSEPERTPTPMDIFTQMSKADTAVSSQPQLDSKKPSTISEALEGDNPFTPTNASETRTAERSQIRVADLNTDTMNDLWKAVEPCWERVSDKSTVSVTLEVSFSPLGNLSKPPQIKRPANAVLDDNRLRSENQAITALAQCGPYLMAFGQQGVQIQFPNGRK